MEGINPHDLILSSARSCAKRWTEEANRSGHHPWAGDVFHRLALALMRRKRLTVPEWNDVRVALACAQAETTIEERAQRELYQLAKAERLTQGPDGLVIVRQAEATA